MFYSRFLNSGVPPYSKKPPRDDLYWSSVVVDYSVEPMAVTGYVLVDNFGGRFDMIGYYPIEKGENESDSTCFHTVKVASGRASSEDISDKLMVFVNKADAEYVKKITFASKIIPVEIVGGVRIAGAIFDRPVVLTDKIVVV